MDSKKTTLKYQELTLCVEMVFGSKMHTPKDFDLLVKHIHKRTNRAVSAPTLRRLWGYQEKGKFKPREYTLNVLARYVGLRSWEHFSSVMDGNGAESSSDFIVAEPLKPTDLAIGDCLRLYWNPDRCVTIRFLGGNDFIVEESINSKLNAGDRFSCNAFIKSKPLYLHNFHREGIQATGYMCGDGIDFDIIRVSDSAE